MTYKKVFSIKNHKWKRKLIWFTYVNLPSSVPRFSLHQQYIPTVLSLSSVPKPDIIGFEYCLNTEYSWDWRGKVWPQLLVFLELLPYIYPSIHLSYTYGSCESHRFRLFRLWNLWPTLSLVICSLLSPTRVSDFHMQIHLDSCFPS